jgi:hypothetical protein
MYPSKRLLRHSYISFSCDFLFILDCVFESGGLLLHGQKQFSPSKFSASKQLMAYMKEDTEAQSNKHVSLRGSMMDGEGKEKSGDA